MKCFRLTIYLLAFLLSACGKQKGGGSFTSTADLNPVTKKTTSKTKAPANQDSSSTAPKPSPEPVSLNPQVSPQCQAAKSKVSQVYNACSGTLYDNDDIVPRSCLDAFSGLTYVECSNINSKVNATISACNPVFKQFSAYLPTSCKSAISALSQ